MSLRKAYYNLNNPRDAEELLNYLEQISSDDDEYEQVKSCNQIDFALLPPQDGHDSDLDDASSDGEENNGMRDIGRGILRQPMEIVTVNQDGEKIELNLNEANKENDDETSSIDSDDIPLAKRFKINKKVENSKSAASERQHIKKKRKWTEENLQRRNERTRIFPTPEPKIVQKIRQENLQPIDMFQLYFSEDFVEYICEQSQKYAIFKGKHDFTVSIREMYIYLGILLLSGYCKVPFRRMYWETKPDSFNNLVSNSISRDRFETIHRFLHFNDNTAIDPDNRVYKVEPLLNHFNNVSQELAEPLGKSFSLDEAMEPYFGHHGMKQFIRGKPIRYGFKFWCLTTAEGYLLKFRPYCGSGDKVEGKTLGSSVTEKLCVGYLPANSTVFLDNFFYSLSLLNNLKDNNIECIGTIRSDRIEKAPLKELKKFSRGATHVLRDTNDCITLTRWNDNNQVTIATNVVNDGVTLTKGLCKRWSKQQRKHVEVDQPTVISLYNQGMGGVDLFDKMRGLYRIRIRSRKWYWPFIRFCLNGSLVNMWILYKFVYPKMGLLQFIRRIVLSILTAPESLKGPKPKCSRNVLKEVRYDKTDHLIDKQPTQRRCAHCGKCAKFSCVKCNLGLHPDLCFRVYHTPPQ